MIVRTHLAVYPSNSATSRGVLPSFACHKICQWVRSTASVVCRYRFWSSSAVKSVFTSTRFAIPPLYTTWTDFISRHGSTTIRQLLYRQLRCRRCAGWPALRRGFYSAGAHCPGECTCRAAGDGSEFVYSAAQCLLHLIRCIAPRECWLHHPCDEPFRANE